MPTLVFLALSLGLALWCVVDLLPRSSAEVTGLPKEVWLLVLLVPLVGPAAYLLAGRASTATSPRRPSRPSAPPVVGPDDDAEFQALLRRRVQEQRRRAEQQRRSAEQPGGDLPPDS